MAGGGRAALALLHRGAAGTLTCPLPVPAARPALDLPDGIVSSCLLFLTVAGNLLLGVQGGAGHFLLDYLCLTTSTLQFSCTGLLESVVEI